MALSIVATAAEPAAPGAGAAKPAPAPAAAPAAAPSEPGGTHKVVRELLKLELNLKGAYEPGAAHEVVVQPDSWAMLEVVKAVDHAQAVKKGDVLLQLETEKIDEAIADAQLKRATTELALQQSEAALKALRSTTPLDLKAAERAAAVAQEDLAKYLKIDRPLAEKGAAMNLKSAEQALENQRDELRQLEKMYKADDLTEETEEIVLKRQRRAVEMMEFMLETSRANYQDTMKNDIPRKQESLEVAAARQDAALAKAKVALPAALAQAERDFEKAKIDRTREDDKFKKLQADREKLVVRSPIDGVAYYGRFVRGKWAAAEGATETLKPGAAVVKGNVVMTVVALRPLGVRASVSEAEMRHIRAGLSGTSRPTALPDVRVPVAVDRVDTIPAAADSFEVRLRVTGDVPAAIVPGMTCTVRLLPYIDRNAVTVPAKAVFTDELDDTKTFVYVQKDGKPQKRDVVVGQRIDEKAEIVRGLSEGDEVLLERPKPAKDAAKPAAEAKPKPETKTPPKPEPPKPPAPKQPEAKKPSPAKPAGK